LPHPRIEQWTTRSASLKGTEDGWVLTVAQGDESLLPTALGKNGEVLQLVLVENPPAAALRRRQPQGYRSAGSLFLAYYVWAGDPDH
jgi:hypothetical protein